MSSAPRGIVVWFTGLPRAGKSSLALAVRDRLAGAGTAAILLDGDEVRAALHPTPGYDEIGRAAFYQTLASLAALLSRQGFVVLVPATAHRRAFRDGARRLAPRFLEIFVDTSPEVCRARPGGELYLVAGTVSALPGAGLPYEAPLAPDVHVAEGELRATVDAVMHALDQGRTSTVH